MKIKRNETYGAFIKRIRQTDKLTQADLAIDEFARKIKEHPVIKTL